MKFAIAQDKFNIEGYFDRITAINISNSFKMTDTDYELLGIIILFYSETE